MTEPDVAFTDFLIAAECALFAFLIFACSKPSQPLRTWFTLFYSATGLSALSGGIVHGFFSDELTLGYRLLWPATLLCIGLSAVSGWLIAGHLLLQRQKTRMLFIFISVGYALYSAAVIKYSQSFVTAIVFYVPAILFMTVAFVYRFSRDHQPRIRDAIAGFLLSFVAAGIQQAKIGIHPQYFNHNALYHLLQAIALYLIYRGAIWFVAHEMK
jgi:MFS family permease